MRRLLASRAFAGTGSTPSATLAGRRGHATAAALASAPAQPPDAPSPSPGPSSTAHTQHAPSARPPSAPPPVGDVESTPAARVTDYTASPARVSFGALLRTLATAAPDASAAAPLPLASEDAQRAARGAKQRDKRMRRRAAAAAAAAVTGPQGEVNGSPAASDASTSGVDRKARVAAHSASFNSARGPFPGASAAPPTLRTSASSPSTSSPEVDGALRETRAARQARRRAEQQAAAWAAEAGSPATPPSAAAADGAPMPTTRHTPTSMADLIPRPAASPAASSPAPPAPASKHARRRAARAAEAVVDVGAPGAWPIAPGAASAALVGALAHDPDAPALVLGRAEAGAEDAAAKAEESGVEGATARAAARAAKSARIDGPPVPEWVADAWGADALTPPEIPRGPGHRLRVRAPGAGPRDWSVVYATRPQWGAHDADGAPRAGTGAEAPVVDEKLVAQLGWEGEAWTNARDAAATDSGAATNAAAAGSGQRVPATPMAQPAQSALADNLLAAGLAAQREAATREAREARQTAPHLVPRAPKRVVEGRIEPRSAPMFAELASPSEMKPIATLAHGLDRVLFSPGVHWLQDPRSKVYNFTPSLHRIPAVEEFAFERLTGFIKSSSDNDLWTLAKQERRPYAGSTSSMTSFLSQIYFLISAERELNTSGLSSHFAFEPRTFAPTQRIPPYLLMNYRDGVYSLDSGWGKPKDAEKTVLTWMGTMLENFLTHDDSSFGQLLRVNPPEPEHADPMREAYRYAMSEKFVMRSQLDCVDPRLPGTGVFDIKTRAALPIRMDQLNYKENSSYQITDLVGPTGSFEREYYDLIRGAFLKYSFQVRIGNMDGVFVAYHNTARIFGFQYVSLAEMDTCLFGGPGRGGPVFERCVALMEAVCDQVAAVYPEQSVRLMVETREGSDEMYVWALPHVFEGEQRFSPITEFVVRAKSFLDNVPTPSSTAVGRCLEQSWSIAHTITTTGAPAAEAHARLEQCEARAFRTLALPEGVSPGEMEAHYAAIDHGQRAAREAAAGRPPPAAAPFDPRMFGPASRTVRLLREQARAGRDILAADDAASAGRPQIVLGQPLPEGIEAYRGSAPGAPAVSAMREEESPLDELSPAMLDALDPLSVSRATPPAVNPIEDS